MWGKTASWQLAPGATLLLTAIHSLRYHSKVGRWIQVLQVILVMLLLQCFPQGQGGASPHVGALRQARILASLSLSLSRVAKQRKRSRRASSGHSAAHITEQQQASTLALLCSAGCRAPISNAQPTFLARRAGSRRPCLPKSGAVCELVLVGARSKGRAANHD